MGPQETRSILTIALMAAFADGLKDERERAAVKRVAEALGPEAGLDLPALYRDVLMSKPDLAQVAAALDRWAITTDHQQPRRRILVKALSKAFGAHGANHDQQIGTLVCVHRMPEFAIKH